MLRAGLTRLIIANEVGGAAAARRLAAMLANHRDAEIHIFADSLATAAALQAAWQGRGDLPRLGILVEVGAARGGARTQAAAEEIIDFVLSQETRTFVLSGVAAYEGAAATADPQETAGRIASLMALTKTVYLEIRQRVGVARPLIVTAGGSVYFDMVVKALAPAIGRDENASLILRSGAIFFHDHGTYERGLAALDARAGFEFNGSRAKASEVFQPALRVWAEVLSQPQARIAVCGMGLRDVANDQGVPRALARYRGHQRRTLHDVVVDRLNDQHAFVAFGDAADLQVGDVIEFGLSHPCTCLDRHAVVYGLDETMTVSAVFLTSFG